MSHCLVVDASAALRLVLGLDGALEIGELLEKSQQVLAPVLLHTEAANGLWKYVVHGDLPRDEAAERLREAVQLIDEIVPDRDLLEEALFEAVKHRHPVYDLLYAVLARRRGGTVVTFDKRLGRLLERLEIPSLP